MSFYMVYEVTPENDFKLYCDTCEREFKSRFTTTQNHFKIELIKPSFWSTFDNWRTNPKISTYVGKYLCIQRPINVTQGVGIYT